MNCRSCGAPILRNEANCKYCGSLIPLVPSRYALLEFKPEPENPKIPQSPQFPESKSIKESVNKYAKFADSYIENWQEFFNPNRA